MKLFKTARKSLGGLDAKAIGTLLATAADITLILDATGVVRDMAIGNDALAADLGDVSGWPGRPWIDTVMTDSRPKVEALLHDARSGEATRWRHVNQRTVAEAALPVLYSTLLLDGDGRVAVIGRDQRLVSSLHQRLIDTQHSMEREYARLRHAEARYRVLFQLSAEAVAIIDAISHAVVEANPAAEQLCGGKSLAGQSLLDSFHGADAAAVGSMLAEVRFAGRTSQVQARLGVGSAQMLTVSASPFRQDRAALLLVRLLPGEGAGRAAAMQPSRAGMLRFAEDAPDAMVVTGQDGRVISANAAFLELAQLDAEEQAAGQPLERWLGRPGLEFEVLVATLRTRGAVRLFGTTLQGEHGTAVEVEVSAVPLAHRGNLGYGFAIRDVGARLAPRAAGGPPLPRPVEQLTELVGRVPLKELVRETTDVIERMAIEAALQLTDDNRAQAAEMLGLSRQSLYVKLRRYGLGSDGDGDGDGED
ncbi:transcriptional regulator PpsR [Muricoccus vinaceus]|uniref:Transcriptional regulator PpsR n=1 Tax=Muricoccus vinaceus TaxID=424704 RepID=A0ABV6J113_9PROT